jgi:hypothetical protein
LSFRSAAKESAVNPPPTLVISTEAVHSLTVNRAAERSSHSPLPLLLLLPLPLPLHLPLLLHSPLLLSLPLHLGTPRLQPWVSPPHEKKGALAPGVCPFQFKDPHQIKPHISKEICAFSTIKKRSAPLQPNHAYHHKTTSSSPRIFTTTSKTPLKKAQ